LKNAKANWWGTKIFNDGTRYEGNFENGKINWQGTMTWFDGSSYTGKWTNNSFSYEYNDVLITLSIVNGYIWVSRTNDEVVHAFKKTLGEVVAFLATDEGKNFLGAA
jgi:hypothetical protein